MGASGAFCATDTGVDTEAATVDALQEELLFTFFSFLFFFEVMKPDLLEMCPLFSPQRFKDELKAKGVMRFTSAAINSRLSTTFEAFPTSRITQNGLPAIILIIGSNREKAVFNLHSVAG